MKYLSRFLALMFLTTGLSLGGNMLPLQSPSYIGWDLGVGSAHAQDQRPNFFQRLFRENVKPPKQKTRIVKEIQRPRVKQKAKKVSVPRKSKPQVKTRVVKPVAAQVTAVPRDEVQKSENARRVLVVGDFIADGMSQALSENFVSNPNVIVEARVSGSSGLVRDDFYNWSAEIPSIIETLKPSIVVVMLGSNDRQIMRVDGKAAKVRSLEWDGEYKKRVRQFVTAIRQTNTPLMRVGSPPFKFRTMNADILAFNQVFREMTEKSNGVYVDIWDGFVDENGEFLMSGADVKGQQVRLRATDGINFTKSGKQKMAFYVERQLMPLLGDAASPLLVSLSDDTAPLMVLPPLETEADLQRTNPISVDDPELDGGSVLLGDINEQRAAISNPLRTKSARQRLVEDGLSPPAQPGRADNFAWPG